MLSILIPVYNFNICLLVRSIHEQAMMLNMNFEVLCFDDGSAQKYNDINKKVTSLPNVYYTRLEKNIGRSAIRNLLTEKAKYDHLLFIDCDLKVTSENYLKNYFFYLPCNCLVYGGICYQPNSPEDKKNMLHWLFGSEREVIPLEERRKKPYKSFQTNNFIIPKKIFLDIRLNEKLIGYGHEDTLFGNDIKLRKIKIIHIANPLCHLGLEPADIFLKKTDEGIKNLYYLIQQNKNTEHIKIVSCYKWLHLLGLKRLFLFLFQIIRKKAMNNLLSNAPKLFYFDIYKLNKLIEVDDVYKKSL